MGKAGIVIIPIIVVACVVVLVWAIAAIAKWAENDEPKERKSVRNKAKLADEAYDLIRDMMFPETIDGDITLLSKNHRAKAKSWAEKYGKVTR